jgi:hypothetical protein
MPQYIDREFFENFSKQTGQVAPAPVTISPTVFKAVVILDEVYGEVKDDITVGIFTSEAAAEQAAKDYAAPFQNKYGVKVEYFALEYTLDRVESHPEDHDLYERYVLTED